MILRILLAWLISASLAYAGNTLVPLTGAGLSGPAAAGGAYIGPGDIVSGAYAAWSCARAYNAAYGTGNLCDIVDTATGGFACTIKANPNGFADLTSLSCTGGTLSVTTFCTVTHAGCSVTKAYDQSGNTNCTTACGATQATLASMPTLTLNALNSLPCMTFSGTQELNTPVIANGDTSQPITTLAVSERTGTFTAYNTTFGADSAGFQSLYLNSANKVQPYAGTLIAGATASDSAFHALQFIYNDPGNSAMVVDGVATTGLTIGSGKIANAQLMSLGSADGSTNKLTGTMCEVLAYAVAFNSTQYGNMNTNQHGTNGYNF